MGKILLVNPPNVRIIKALISRKRTNADIIETMIGIALVLLRVIVNTPINEYTMTLKIPTKIIAKKNINPATKEPTKPRITSPTFSALISIEKLKRMAKESISRNSNKKIVVVLMSNNTPITILNVLIIFIIDFHFYFRFREYILDNYL